MNNDEHWASGATAAGIGRVRGSGVECAPVGAKRRRFEDSMEYALFERAYETLVARVEFANRRTVRDASGETRGAASAAELADRAELERVHSYLTSGSEPATAASVYQAMQEARVPTWVIGCEAHRRWVRREARVFALRRRAGLALVGVVGLILVAYAASAEVASAVTVVPRTRCHGETIGPLSRHGEERLSRSGRCCMGVDAKAEVNGTGGAAWRVMQ